MKHFGLLFTVLLLSANGHSQTFSYNNEPSIGFDENYYVIDSSANALSGETGNMASWDYSAATGYTGNVDGRAVKRVRVLDPNSTVYGTDYPAAVKVVMIEDFLLNFWFSSTSNRMYLGFVMPGTGLGDIQGIFGNDPELVMEYDFMFEDEVNDQLAGNLTFDINGMAQDEPCNGQSHSKYDGSGSFQAPDGTVINNVRRWVLKDTITVNIQFFGDIDLIREQYQYFDNDAQNMPLFIYTNVKAIGNSPTPLIDETLVLSRIRPSNLDNAGISENSLQKPSLYPNPTSNHLYLDGDFTAVEFQIIDMQGKVLQKGEFNGKLNLEHLAPGIYQLQLNANNSVENYRFEKIQ